MNFLRILKRNKGKTYQQQVELASIKNEEVNIYELQNRTLQAISDLNFRQNIRRQANIWFNEWLNRDCQNFIMLVNPKYCIRKVYVNNSEPIDFKEEAFKEFKRLKELYINDISYLILLNHLFIWNGIVMQQIQIVIINIDIV